MAGSSEPTSLLAAARQLEAAARRTETALANALEAADLFSEAMSHARDMRRRLETAVRQSGAAVREAAQLVEASDRAGAGPYRAGLPPTYPKTASLAYTAYSARAGCTCDAYAAPT